MGPLGPVQLLRRKFRQQNPKFQSVISTDGTVGSVSLTLPFIFIFKGELFISPDVYKEI